MLSIYTLLHPPGYTVNLTLSASQGPAQHRWVPVTALTHRVAELTVRHCSLTGAGVTTTRFTVGRQLRTMPRREPPCRLVWDSGEHAAKSIPPAIHPFHCWAMMNVSHFLLVIAPPWGLYPRVGHLPTTTRFTVRQWETASFPHSGNNGVRPVSRGDSRINWTIIDRSWFLPFLTVLARPRHRAA